MRCNSPLLSLALGVDFLGSQFVELSALQLSLDILQLLLHFEHLILARLELRFQIQLELS